VIDVAPRQVVDPNAMAATNTHAVVCGSLNGLSGRVGDVGAGQGALALALANLGFDVFACDRDAATFAVDHPKIRFQAADLNTAFPFGDESLDVICAVEVIEHLENPRHVLRECHRALRQNGTLIVTTPNILNVVSWITLPTSGNLMYFSQREYLSNHHITPLRLQDFKNMFAEIGFRLERVDYNAGKLPIPKLRHRIPLFAKPFRNRWLGESLIVWATKRPRA